MKKVISHNWTKVKSIVAKGWNNLLIKNKIYAKHFNILKEDQFDSVLLYNYYFEEKIKALFIENIL